MTQRHVWVTLPFHSATFPGLLLDWRDVEGRRELLVTYWHEDSRRAVTAWLPREDVRPA